MSINRTFHKSAKAASAALALAAITPVGAANGVVSSIPELPDARASLDSLKKDFHFRVAQTPQELKDFITDFQASFTSTEATAMLADWYFCNGEYALALQYYSRISDNTFSGDTRERFLYRKALSQLKCGFYSEAESVFRSLLNSKEFGDDARFYAAYIDYVNGKYDEAYGQFLRIKDSGRKGAEAEFYINQMDYRKGDFKKVVRTSERLLSSGDVPDELKAETMRVGGLAAFKTGETPMARTMLARYNDLMGDGAEISALYALGSIYYDEGNMAKALPLFSVVTEYPGPLAQSAWLFIGQIYLNQGDPQAASLAFDKASRESWDNSVAETAAYNLAVNSTSGMALPFSDAATAMENFIDTYPSSPYASSLSAYLANAYYARRDYESALRQVEKINPPTAETRAMKQKILYQLGVSQLQQGNIKEAIRNLSLASAADTPDKEVAAQAKLWLGDAFYADKNYSSASSAYVSAIASGLLGENSSLAEYDLGYSRMKTGRYSQAEADFKKAIELGGLTRSQKMDARLRYADCLYYTGKYAEALGVFRDIKLEGGTEGAYAQIREAELLGRDGRLNDKIAILERVASNPDAGIWQATTLSRLADAYSENGEDRKAAEIYSKMLDSKNGGADNSQIYYSLASNAENLYNAGDLASAYEAYKRLEKSGIPALYPSAVMGIMRTSGDNAEIAEYTNKAVSLPGITAEETDEAIFLGAQAGLKLGKAQRAQAIAALESLSRSSDRLWGARAGAVLGEELIKDGELAKAEEVLTYLVDTGSDDNYWLARGYIALADVYINQKKEHLARLYLETLQSNYPGNEKDIRQMISSRLKALDK